MHDFEPDPRSGAASFGPALRYLGFTHKRATISVRERLQCDRVAQRRLLDSYSEFARERAILCTCERFEIYAFSDAFEPQPWLERLGQVLAVDQRGWADQVHVLEADAAAWHLLRVTAGLESRIVGEPQILSQVRQAYLNAMEAGSIGPILSALLRGAVYAAKRVRREAPLQIAPASSARSAVEYVTGHVDAGRPADVLVAGSGRLAQDVLALLMNRRRFQVRVASRDEERARNLAARYYGRGFGLEPLARELSSCDAVVACSNAPPFVLSPSMIAHRPGRPLVVVDLGFPRNVDPAVARLPGVDLIDLDELLGSELGQRVACGEAEAILEQALRQFQDWQRGRRASSAIAALLRAGKPVNPSAERAFRKSVHERILGLKEAVAA
jgi:glutamyl-tRNA reductase